MNLYDIKLRKGRIDKERREAGLPTMYAPHEKAEPEPRRCGLRSRSMRDLTRVTSVGKVAGVTVIGHKDVPEDEVHVIDSQTGQHIQTIKLETS